MKGKIITKLEYSDLEKFRRLNTEVFVINLNQEYALYNGQDPKLKVEEFKRFFRDLGYRYKFQVNKVIIDTNTGYIHEYV